MSSCRYWMDQPDGVHGFCKHPDAQPGDHCILNTGDECVFRSPVMTSMQISRDTLEALREYGYPAEKAVKKLLEIATASKSS